MIYKKENRDILADVLKGFGIILVVLGHCIQTGSGSGFLENAAYFDDKLYQFIYTFHMPLFMAVSGYYAWNSINRAASMQDIKKMIKKKCACMIVPNVAWKPLEMAYIASTGGYMHYNFEMLCKELFIGILTNFWFLWAVLYAFLIVCLMHYRLKDSAWIYALIFTAMFFTPDGLGLNAYKYMLPYYLIGFYVNKNRSLLPVGGINQGKKMLAAFFCGIVFFALASFFNRDSFIYLTGYKLIGKDCAAQLGIDIYRFAVGLFGIAFWSLFWSILINMCQKRTIVIRLLAYIGMRGMGIYIISSLLATYLLHPATLGFKPGYAVNLAETAALLALSLAIAGIMGRSKWTCRLVGRKLRKPD